MTEFRRLISYIYEYEGKVKGKNVGFAKLETRNGLCKLNVSVKKLYMGSGSLGVYLLSARQEIFLGNMFLRNGGGEFRTVIQAADVEQSGETMDDCYGLTIHEQKDSWKVYTTIWEDVAAQAAEMASESVMEEKIAEEKVTEDKIIKEQNVKERAMEEKNTREEKVNKRAVEEKITREEKVNERAVEEKIIGEETVKERILEEKVIENALENIEKLPKYKTENEWKAEVPILEDSEDGEEKNRELHRKDKEISGINRKISVGDEKIIENAEKIIEKVAGKAEKITKEIIEEKEDADLEKKTQENKSEKNKPEKNKSEGKIPQQTVIRTSRSRMNNNAAPPRRPQGQMFFNLRQQQSAFGAPAAANSFTQPPAEAKEQQPFIRQHEEEPLIIGDPEALAKLDEEEKITPVPLWDFLSKTYPKIQAFESQYGCEILVIKPQDIGLLPREVWVYGNNSFLLHGYYNYRYLIVARLENPHGSPRYLLGVPGHYYSNEKYMASMFGFPNFVLSKKQQAQDGRFGYWYTDIRLGDGNVASAVVRR